jgi:hypothetical protein
VIHRGVAVAIACVITALTQPVLAASPTADLIPDANYPWEADVTEGGPLTAQQIYGDQAGLVKGFVDAYMKVWTQPDKALSDRLERYSSVFWAAYRFGQSEGAAKKNTQHSSFATVPGYGSGAYEVTNPANANGVSDDIFVFAQGDYMAVIVAAARDGAPDHAALMAQARAQLATLPIPTSEYSAFGNGVLTAVLIVGGIMVAAALVVGLIVFVVLRRSGRPAVAGGGGITYSPDGRYWWDGSAWRPVQPPPAPPPTPPGPA